MSEQKVLDKPCKECPFKRTSLPGWLGEASGNPEYFLAPVWDGVQLQPCHMSIDWDNSESTENKPLCRGLLQMMRNSCKQPLNTYLATLVRQLEPDHSIVFQWKHEFIQHHEGKAL